jgi:hypothetical protein
VKKRIVCLLCLFIFSSSTFLYSESLKGIPPEKLEAIKMMAQLYSDGYGTLYEPSIEYKEFELDPGNFEPVDPGDRMFFSVALFTMEAFCLGSNWSQFVVLFKNQCGGERKEGRVYYSIAGIFSFSCHNSLDYLSLSDATLDQYNGDIRLYTVKQHKELRILHKLGWWYLDEDALDVFGWP